ncbi:CASH domain-dontaining protein [Methanophagales archaeon]|nr:CASH domain-dontaining protein [Methanophagales archaeon]
MKNEEDENRKKVSSAQISLRKKDTLAAALVIVILLFAVASVSATDYQVHEGESIQAAINMSHPGDTIIVHNGTYTENVVVNRSNILIRSANGSAVTIVQSNRTGMHVFNITDQENITLDGFTIRDASAVLNTTKNVNATSQTTVSILTVPTQPTVPEGPSIDGFLSVTSTPSGADITLDGTPIGEKTPHSMPLMPGTHTLKLTLPGYLDWTKGVQVTGGETTSEHATLIPIPTITGFLSITSTPAGADITLDGRPIGEKTPHSVPINPGTYTIKLTLSGYHDWTQSARVTGGETTNVHATLTQIPGAVTVTSTPSGAAIYVETYLGDSCIGKTPHTNTKVSPGHYTIKLTLDGYHDWTKSGQVTGGETTDVHATLTPIPPPEGFLTVTSTPSGAAIIIDDMPTGVLTPFTMPLQPGPHTLKLTLEGYHDWTEKVQITDGETTYAQATLTLIPPIEGVLTVTSTPSGAAITIDGTSIGETTPHTRPMVPGAYTIKLTLDGYHDWKQRVQVMSGETRYVQATMTLSPPIDGVLSVTSTPSCADIAIDGAPIGETTPHSMSMMPGYHTIELTLDCYQDWTEGVQVTSDETTNVDATLTQVTGSISVTSTPSGAGISFDGVAINEITPYTIPNVKPGYYTMTLTLEGYHDWTETVSVTAGETVNISATLAPIPGAATVTSTPSGAAIYVETYLGDLYIAETPHTDTAVSPGNYTLKLTLDGYQNLTGEIHVTSGETAYIDAILTPCPLLAGIYMNNASNCVIKNSSILNISVMGNCSAIGIAVFNSSGNAISNGEIINCEEGILIASGSNNTIESNIIRNNTIVGVRIDSGGINTEIHENCFIDNESQAIDDGTDNIWTSNYWSPPPGGNYTIPGAAESEDSDPLDECPQIEEPA